MIFAGVIVCFFSAYFLHANYFVHSTRKAHNLKCWGVNQFYCEFLPDFGSGFLSVDCTVSPNQGRQPVFAFSTVNFYQSLDTFIHAEFVLTSCRLSGLYFFPFLAQNLSSKELFLIQVVVRIRYL
jgi:hypothetical protein